MSSNFPLYTIDNAPEKSRPTLAGLKEAFGFIPNVAGTMAASPELISGFIGVFKSVHSGTFTEPQIQTLLLTNAVTNACTWAVAFHTTLSLQAGLAPADVQAMRDKRLPADPQLAALSQLARQLIEQRGHLGDADVDRFAAAGFKREQALEVILVSAASTITNYVGSLTQPPLEETFQPNAWTA